MHNIFLDERTARDIDLRVAKVLRDLAHPEPPLSLERVRELLELDRAYYSSSDTSALEETVHRLRVAGKQVLAGASRLVEVVRTFDLKALFAPDRRRILLDGDEPPPKQRWNEAHEIVHSLVPWHADMMHGDKRRTLSLECQLRIEAEANYGAGRLLFLGDAFAASLLDGPITFARVRELSKAFGNTMTTGLWRTVEMMNVPAFGLVGQHPRFPEQPNDAMVRYFLRSRRFEEQFPGVSDATLVTALKRFCRGRRGPIGQHEVVLGDANGVQHAFFVEVFFNGHDALTLGLYRRARPVAVAVP